MTMKSASVYRTTWFIVMIVTLVVAPRSATAKGDVSSNDASNSAESKPPIDPALRERLYTEGPPAWDRIRKRNQQVEYSIRKRFTELDSQQTPRSDTTIRQIKIDGANILSEELETPQVNLYVNDAPVAETPFAADFQPLRVEASNDRY